jgi:hypothetical protein
MACATPMAGCIRQGVDHDAPESVDRRISTPCGPLANSSTDFRVLMGLEAPWPDACLRRMHAFAGNHSRCEYARKRPDVMMQAATTRCNGSIRLLKTWKIGPFIFRRFTHGRGVNTTSYTYY